MKHYGSLIAEAIMDNEEAMLQLAAATAGGAPGELEKTVGDLHDKITDIIEEGAQAWQEILFGEDGSSLDVEEAAFRIYIIKRLLDAYEKAAKAAGSSALYDIFAVILNNVGKDTGIKFCLKANNEEADNDSE